MLSYYPRPQRGYNMALGKVKDYCENWHLKINADKTKVMIFNKSGRLVKEKFTLGDNLLENVNSYTYLGLEFVRVAVLNLQWRLCAKKHQKQCLS